MRQARTILSQLEKITQLIATPYYKAMMETTFIAELQDFCASLFAMLPTMEPQDLLKQHEQKIKTIRNEIKKYLQQSDPIHGEDDPLFKAFDIFDNENFTETLEIKSTSSNLSVHSQPFQETPSGREDSSDLSESSQESLSSTSSSPSLVAVDTTLDKETTLCPLELSSIRESYKLINDIHLLCDCAKKMEIHGYSEFQKMSDHILDYIAIIKERKQFSVLREKHIEILKNCISNLSSWHQEILNDALLKTSKPDHYLELTNNIIQMLTQLNLSLLEKQVDQINRTAAKLWSDTHSQKIGPNLIFNRISDYIRDYIMLKSTMLMSAIKGKTHEIKFLEREYNEMLKDFIFNLSLWLAEIPNDMVLRNSHPTAHSDLISNMREILVRFNPNFNLSENSEHMDNSPEITKIKNLSTMIWCIYFIAMREDIKERPECKKILSFYETLNAKIASLMTFYKTERHLKISILEQEYKNLLKECEITLSAWETEITSNEEIQTSHQVRFSALTQEISKKLNDVTYQLKYFRTTTASTEVEVTTALNAQASQIKTKKDLLALIKDSVNDAFEFLFTHPSWLTTDFFLEITQVSKAAALSVVTHPMSEIFFFSYLIPNKKAAQKLLSHVDPRIAQVILERYLFKNLFDTEMLRLFPFHAYTHIYWNQPAQRKKYLARNPLDLADSKNPRKKVEEKKLTQLEMNLALPNKSTVAKRLLNTFFTMKNFVETSLFHVDEKAQGYYAKGKVDFQKDFQTFASNPQDTALPAAFANQLFHLYEHLRANNTLTATDHFNVLECGGGNGNLCRSILTMIQERGKKDPQWQSLFHAIRYHLVDIAPQLVECQKEATKEYKHQVIAQQGDARKLKDVFPTMKMAAVISNELVDMLPAEEAVLNGDAVAISFLVPYLSEKEILTKFRKEAAGFWEVLEKQEPDLSKRLEYYRAKNTELIAKLNVLKSASDAHKATLLCYLGSTPQAEALKANPDYLLLSKKSFLQLQPLYQNAFHFLRYLCDVTPEVTPKMSAFAARHANYWQRSQSSNYPFYPEVHVRDFMASVASILIEGGELIGIDYGHNTYEFEESFRTYKNGKLRRNVTENFNNQDVTHNTNFSVMAKEGMDFELEPMFFGEQGAMRIDDFSPDLVSDLYKDEFNEKLGTMGFKVLLQRKKDGRNLPNYSQRFFGKSLTLTDSETFTQWKQETYATILLYKIIQLPMNDTIERSEASELKDELTKAIMYQNFATALNIACGYGLHLHVEILLEYLPVLGLDINNMSPEGDKTAVKWWWREQIPDINVSQEQRDKILQAFQKHKDAQVNACEFKR